MRCPVCETEVHPPRISYFLPGDHTVTCPNGHTLTITMSIEPRYQPGESVYVADQLHVWEGVFVAYNDNDTARVATPGGEIVAVDVKDLSGHGPST